MVDTTVAGAGIAAERAAERSGVRVMLAEDRARQESVRAIFDLVWPADEGTQVTSNLLRALIHAGAYASLAVDDASGDPVGAALGFPGRDASVPGGVFLHSHMAAVREDLRDRRIGTALKLHQRWWSMDQGIPVVSWTFDPIVRRNARLNIIRLGVEVRDYHPDFYGVMTDAINAGDRTDRLVAWWNVGSERAAIASEGGLAPASAARLRALGARDLVAVGSTDAPAIGMPPSAEETVIVALPEDVVALRRSAPDAALAWRMAVREAFASAYAVGLRVATVTDEGSYVLAPAGEEGA